MDGIGWDGIGSCCAEEKRINYQHKGFEGLSNKRENKQRRMFVSMTSRIEYLAREAADPIEAGKRIRQVYFTNCKLTNRQLTVDLLKKLYERGVGTHEVASIAQGGGVPLIQLPNSILKTMRKSSGPHCLQ